jgi:hypothetical protein
MCSKALGYVHFEADGSPLRLKSQAVPLETEQAVDAMDLRMQVPIKPNDLCDKRKEHARKTGGRKTEKGIGQKRKRKDYRERTPPGRPPGHLTNGSGLQILDSRTNIFAQRRVGNLTVKDSCRESCNRPGTTNEYQHTHQTLSRTNRRQ